MQKLGQSVIFKTIIFMVSIALAAAMLISTIIIVNINRGEYVPSTPFTRSTQLGEYFQSVTWNLINLEAKLTGLWPADNIILIKQLPTLAPALDRSLYSNMNNSNLWFFYRNETTGAIITNIDIQTFPIDRAQLPEALVNSLMSNDYAFHQDYKQGAVRRGSHLPLDGLPPQYNQSLQNMGVKDDIQLTIMLDTSFSKPDTLRSMSIQYTKEQSWTIIAIIVLAASFLLFILAWIFMIRYAGWQKTDPAIKLSWIDRIYGEILIAGSFILAVFIARIAFREFFEILSPYVLFGVAVYPLTGILLLTLIRRYKAGILWQQYIVVRIGQLIKRFYQNRTLFWKVLIAYLAFVLLVFTAISMVTSRSTFVVLVAMAALIFFPTVFILLPIISWSIQFQKVSHAAEKMGLDAFQMDMPREKLKPDLKKLADTLSSTHERIQITVAEQMKSERLKTDLISNVSHDLRTPLTSIISYLDLLKQELDNPEKRAEYLSILDQKSQRLKVLTDNLFEAAKASSGNLPVQMTHVNLNELVHQVAGEYADRLSNRQLELIINEPEDASGHAVTIEMTSDGGHIWRILDNLMTNVCKYALNGTRVYLGLKQEESKAVLELKNISKERLDSSADELQQRFVRGDQSRYTDGSGLGLAIASSLAELLGGKLTIQLDGDLFKTNLALPLDRTGGMIG